MNFLRVWIPLVALTVAVAHAENTNSLPTGSVESNAAPSGVTSNAAPSSITIDGTTYEEVHWGRLTLSTVTMFHKTGVATIPLWKLPKELQERFGYDPQKVAAFQKEQQAKIDRLRFEKENVQVLVGSVTSVIEGKGVILNNQHEAELAARAVESWAQAGAPDPNHLVALGATQLRFYFLACDTKHLSNDSHVECRAYRDGFYTYTTVMGGSQKIDRWVYYSEREAEPPKP